jgi:predicted ATPase/DNA-binding CsgD family transcriptional regulator
MPKSDAYQRAQPRPNNLPLQLTSFVGRMHEIAEIKRQLMNTRLLTLTGSGGAGKTRLSLEVAATVLEDFEDGVWLVELAPLSDPQLVAQEVVLALGVRENPTRSKIETLVEYIQGKEILLVLDNCEHLILACAEFAAQLLRLCPGVRILATSREALRITGETFWQIHPLSLPDGSPTLESLGQSEAGQLFIERAQSVQPAFHITTADAEAIVQICHQLDGIPLAIELAAARVKVLSPSQIASRLDNSLQLLTVGSRTANPRHQTLQAAIDWSYNLLTEPEQRLFRRLAVFVDGFTLEAAEELVDDETEQNAVLPHTVLDVLSSLADKSLIVVNHGQQVRYGILETIRQYAWEKLKDSGEPDQIRQYHLAYYLQLAEEAAPKLKGAEPLTWLSTLETEHDNLRAAMTWSLESGATEEGLRLVIALGYFWYRGGYLSEGSEWYERMLSSNAGTKLVHARAILGAGDLAFIQCNYQKALTLGERSLAMGRQLGDKRAIAASLGLIGRTFQWQGERDQAATLLQESLALFRELGDEWDVARILIHLGDIQLRQGNYEQANTFLEASLNLLKKLGDKWSLALALGALGENFRRQGNYQQAESHFQQGLAIYQELNNTVDVLWILQALAISAVEQGQAKRAVHLWGAAESLREAVHAPLSSSYQSDYAPFLKSARTALGEEAFTTAWSDGRSLTLEQAIALAKSVFAVAEPPSGIPTKTHPSGLTPREIEILRLVATGLTDTQIAERLVISPRTVSKHLQSVYSKLDLPSRSAATRFAIEHGLV